MITLSENTHPMQNLGIFDRVGRFLVGGGLLGYLVLYYELKHPGLGMAWQFSIVSLTLYSILTSIFGWDPFYAWGGLKSGNDRGRNQCGSFPYQVTALFGRAPQYCDCDDERSLEACHSTAQERPLHKVWIVDQEPMIYPSDAVLDEWIVRHMPKLETKPGAGVVSSTAILTPTDQQPVPPMDRAA
ncbi:MAG TPA: hypothetical protein VKA13_05765 [Gammaproteobacteria bacterium]|nr:hypothetical protein [Gammaproteobacteria bacterium]